jgi:uncharacterized protein
MEEGLHEVRIERNISIPMSDGVTLSADIHFPQGDGPFPAVVSYYPYHKDDMIGTIFEYARNLFAQHGYAALLVDFRGTGGSGGLYWDPLDPGEHRDGAEIIEWIARQPWCDGNVGMWGGSYGGITSLQTAAQNPPHLKAIVPMVALADNYTDWAYPGGCLNCMGLYGAWAAYMLAMNLMPPTNADSGGKWYRLWRERLGKALPLGFLWQDHPTHDEYWRSKMIQIERITTPAFLMGSWRDIFPEAMVRIYERLSGPKKLCMGPWSHIPPDLSIIPEPMDQYVDMLRWWDRWLKGKDNGITEEAPVTIFVQGGNTWRYEKDWPIAREERQAFFLSDEKRLERTARKEEGSDAYRAVPNVGAMAGLWDPMSLGIGYPLDQGPDDLLSLAYTSDPLAADTEITGSPEVTLYVSLESGEDVNLVAKLNDVAPDGSSSLITTGWLKGSHHSSHEHPDPLKTGEVVEFRIPLWATSYLVAAGHRLRLSIACSDFPRIFPTPTNPEIRCVFGGSRSSHLTIPVVPPPEGDLGTPDIVRPAPGVNRVPAIIDALPKWKTEYDYVSGTLSITMGMTEYLVLPNGGKIRSEHTGKATVTASRPDGGKVEGATVFAIEMPTGEKITVQTKSWVSLTRMLLQGEVTVDGNRFFEKEWTR